MEQQEIHPPANPLETAEKVLYTAKDYAIWNGFNNQYWPALYLVDAKGGIQYHQFGEGQYDKSEKEIQELLTEAGVPGCGARG